MFAPVWRPILTKVKQMLNANIEEPIHQKKLKDLKSMKTLNNFGFRKQDDTLKEQVIHEFLQPGL